MTGSPLFRVPESFVPRPGWLTASRCKATALPSAWSSSSREGDGLFKTKDSLAERRSGKRGTDERTWRNQITSANLHL